MLYFAELAPLTGHRLTFAAIGFLSFRGQLFIGPRQQLIYGKLSGAKVINARLYDTHTHPLDIVLKAKSLIGTQGVNFHLGVIYRLNFYALAVLKVYNIQHAIGDNYRVAGAESIGHPLREIQAGFHQQQRVAGMGAGLVEFFQHYGFVRFGILIHFAGMVLRVFCYFLILAVGRQAQESFKMLSAIGVGQRPLAGVFAPAVGLVCLQSRCRRAI